jgi:hypothetical protein
MLISPFELSQTVVVWCDGVAAAHLPKFTGMPPGIEGQ